MNKRSYKKGMRYKRPTRNIRQRSRRGKRYKQVEHKSAKRVLAILVIIILVIFIKNKKSEIFKTENVINENSNELLTQEVSSSDVLTEEVPSNDTKIEEVEEVIVQESKEVKEYIEEIINTKKLTDKNFSFFYYNVDTNEQYFFNENTYFTAASTSKVPIALTYYDKINSGEITKDTKYKYSSEAHEDGDGLTDYMYDPGDSIPVSFLIEQMIVNSDNTATNILSLKFGNKELCRKQYAKYTEEAVTDNFYENNIISAKVGFDYIKYLYNNSENYQELIEYMKKSSNGKYLKKYVECDVAHKYGSYNGYIHDYGIVYGDTTYFIGVYTKNVPNAEDLIATINKDILEIK